MGYLHHYVNNFLFCRAIPTIRPSSQRGGDTELVGSEPGPSSQRGGDTELVGSEPGPSSQRGGDTELVGSEPGPSSQRGGDTELVGSEPGPSSQRGGDTKLVGSEPGSLSWKIASPEQIRGYPKAAARQGKRKSGTSIVARHANSTPEMKRLKCVMESKNAKKPKGKCSAKAARKLVVESKERPGSDSDVTCLVCGMRFDRSAEEWIQCVSLSEQPKQTRISTDCDKQKAKDNCHGICKGFHFCPRAALEEGNFPNPKRRRFKPRPTPLTGQVSIISAPLSLVPLPGRGRKEWPTMAKSPKNK
ncbi:hypothetical protein FJT64_018405 [Amphibalanus amphitrite]|uniref:Uncharacterized protein n=1 Tax=Amphibalanus amphitrite TaxID=1232801 RepID=A0A6A4WZA2_AMPAM|nr:hypothetical protein FJT64_018405 [Amphibalanus amphitrite]